MDCNFTVISRNHFYVSTFCVVKQPMFPFSILVSMLLMHASCLPAMLVRIHASPASLQCSYGYMPPASLQCSWGYIPPASLQCSWGCLPLPHFPSMLLRMHCILPLNLLMHTSRLSSTLIMKQIWPHAANPISFWSDSVLSILFPNYNNNEKELLAR